MDVELTSPSIVVQQVDPSNNEWQLFPVSLLFTKDTIAREVNETFTLSIEFNEKFLGVVPPPMIRRTMVGIIQDNSGESRK